MNDEEMVFPKVQWSMFSPNQKEQIVIRTDNWEEMIQLRNKAIATLPQEKAFPDDTGSKAVAPQQTQKGLGNCEKCGAPMKLSTKTGKPYCSDLCWKK